jgi:hypothetical protein
MASSEVRQYYREPPVVWEMTQIYLQAAGCGLIAAGVIVGLLVVFARIEQRGQRRALDRHLARAEDEAETRTNTRRFLLGFDLEQKSHRQAFRDWQSWFPGTELVVTPVGPPGSGIELFHYTSERYGSQVEIRDFVALLKEGRLIDGRLLPTNPRDPCQPLEMDDFDGDGWQEIRVTDHCQRRTQIDLPLECTLQITAEGFQPASTNDATTAKESP